MPIATSSLARAAAAVLLAGTALAQSPPALPPIGGPSPGPAPAPSPAPSPAALYPLYDYDKNLFGVGVPSSWLTIVDREGIDFLTLDTGATNAYCLAYSETHEGTKNATQPDINRELSTPLGEDYWKQFFGTDGNLKVLHVGADGAHPSGISTQNAIVEFDGEGGDGRWPRRTPTRPAASIRSNARRPRARWSR